MDNVHVPLAIFTCEPQSQDGIDLAWINASSALDSQGFEIVDDPAETISSVWFTVPANGIIVATSVERAIDFLHTGKAATIE
jgi:hypothetical protein